MTLLILTWWTGNRHFFQCCLKLILHHAACSLPQQVRLTRSAILSFLVRQTRGGHARLPVTGLPQTRRQGPKQRVWRHMGSNAHATFTDLSHASPHRLLEACTPLVTHCPHALPETLYHRDDAPPYIAYVMLIWAAPIPADRWHCSL